MLTMSVCLSVCLCMFRPGSHVSVVKSYTERSHGSSSRVGGFHQTDGRWYRTTTAYQQCTHLHSVVSLSVCQTVKFYWLLALVPLLSVSCLLLSTLFFNVIAAVHIFHHIPLLHCTMTYIVHCTMTYIVLCYIVLWPILYTVLWPILYCDLYCTVLYCTMTYIVLWPILYCAILYYATLYYDQMPEPDCVLPTLEHWPSVALRAPSATEHLLPQHRGCGTVCHLICGNLDCHMDNLGIHWRHFYLGSRATGAVWPLLTAL